MHVPVGMLVHGNTHVPLAMLNGRKINTAYLHLYNICTHLLPKRSEMEQGGRSKKERESMRKKGRVCELKGEDLLNELSLVCIGPMVCKTPVPPNVHLHKHQLKLYKKTRVCVCVCVYVCVQNVLKTSKPLSSCNTSGVA